MRLVDKEAAKAELLRVMGDVQAYGAYFDGIRYVIIVHKLMHIKVPQIDLIHCR